MKTLLIALLAVGCAAGETLSQQEREKAIQHLNQTHDKFLASIRGLSAEQWSFKPAPDVWSVAEVAEHITVSEGTILDLVQKKIMTAPPDAQLLEQSKGKDDFLLKAIVDRSQKAQAPEFLRPASRWTQAQIAPEFEARRARTIDYARTTSDDLRGHAFAHPAFKALDAYQWVLLISGHSARHTLQIEEVKSNPNFPKK